MKFNVETAIEQSSAIPSEADDFFDSTAFEPLEQYPVHTARVDIEIASLGAALRDEAARDAIVSSLSIHHFTDNRRKTVFSAIAEMNSKGMAVDIVTVGEFMNNNGTLNVIGGTLVYLGELTRSSFAVSNADTYARLLHDAHTLRGLVSASDKINAIARSPMDTHEKIQASEQLIVDLSTQQSVGPVRAYDAMGDLVEIMEGRSERGDELTGLATGFESMDEMTNGLQGGDLIVIAGRPSMGKTTLAENIFTKNTMNGKVGVFFSLEMTATQILERMFASNQTVSLSHIKSAEMDDTEWMKLTTFIASLKTSQAYIDDSPSITVGEIRARSRALHRREGLDLIVIDYLQLITPGKGESQSLKIADISRQLKALARELNVPVILLSQLNRSLEQRQDKRPMMSDLRESGAIEQDADVIAFIYRDEMYNEDSDSKGMAEVVIRKHRNGATGTVITGFQGQYCRFSDLADNYDDLSNSGFTGASYGAGAPAESTMDDDDEYAWAD